MLPSAEVSRYQGDLQNPDVATAQTIEVMCSLIDRAANDPVVKLAARDAVRRFRGGPLYAAAGVNPWQNPGALASSIWWWAKHALTFVHHEGMIQVWFNERDQLQLLISPDLLMRMKNPRGDCAIYTMLVCAMLKALGLHYEIITAAVTPNSPIYDHVWARCPDANYLNLDASHGSYPGWQVPLEHRNRTQVWDESGTPVEDNAPQFRGLHAYNPRPSGPILPSRLALVPGVRFAGPFKSGGFERGGLGRYRGLGFVRRGLGDDGSDTVTTLSPGIDTSNVPITNPATGYPTVVPPASGTSDPFTNALAQSLPGLLSAWTQIGGKVLAPSVTYTGPGGVSYSAPAGSTAASTLPLSIGTLSSTSFLPIILLGGLGLVLVLAFAGKR